MRFPVPAAKCEDLLTGITFANGNMEVIKGETSFEVRYTCSDGFHDVTNANSYTATKPCNCDTIAAQLAPPITCSGSGFFSFLLSLLIIIIIIIVCVFVCVYVCVFVCV